MINRKVTIINRTKFPTQKLENITLALLVGQLAPSFYLICENVFSCKGITLTNLDKPTIIIFIKDLGQFAETFVHELTHLQQHSNNYADEQQAEEREVVVSDKSNPMGTTLNPKETANIPKLKQSKRDYQREYYQRPYVKAKQKLYRQRPDVRAHVKAYLQQPHIKKRRREQGRDYQRKQYCKPEVKEARRLYRQRPEIKQRYKQKYLERKYNDAQKEKAWRNLSDKEQIKLLQKRAKEIMREKEN